MRNRSISRSPNKQNPNMAIDYTEVPRSPTHQAEEGFPSSFQKTETGAKSNFPWMRSYMVRGLTIANHLLRLMSWLKNMSLTSFLSSVKCRRRLSFAAVATAFLAVGATVTFIMMHQHGNVPTFGSVKPDPALLSSANAGMKAMSESGRKLQIATWNIAAINNNPFEYW
jgi:hypothetical protein